MSISDKLGYLLTHYQHTRGVGHTHALIEGLKAPTGVRYDGQYMADAVVMASSIDTARRLFPFLAPNQHTGWSMYDDREAFRLWRRQCPLVLDNSAVITILQDTLAYIEELEVQLRQANIRLSTQREGQGS